MNYDYDVIVVGGGFAGVTAARESALRGDRTLLLEGRDRLGGRTMTEYFDDGTAADLGGTYVHWTQPHLWAEISRYGLTDQVREGIVGPELAGHVEDGEVVWRDAKEVIDAEESASLKLVMNSKDVFPVPFRPFYNREAVEALDKVSWAERLEGVDLTPDEVNYAYGMLAGAAGRPLDESSYLSTLRWFAIGGDNYHDYDDMELGWKLECGTGGLLKLMLADGGTEVRLNSVVTGIRTEADHTVVTVNGETITAGAVVIATPSSAWLNLDLSPALPAGQEESTRNGFQCGSLAKSMVRIKGETRSFRFRGDLDSPMMAFTDKFFSEDEQVLTVFPWPQDDKPITREDVAGWVKRVLPHAEVLEVRVGMHYISDPMSGGGNAYYTVGQLTKYNPHSWTHLSDRVFFATSDISVLFNGFIDGAIESGLRAARDVRGVIDADQKAAVPVHVDLTVTPAVTSQSSAVPAGV